MLFRELSFVLLYVSAFGFSDYIVKTFGLTSFWYLLYYSVLFMVGVVGVRVLGVCVGVCVWG